jgi:N-acyl-D-aspartate/D-glutamate deacylase
MDLALRNATIIDGAGRARYGGDIGVVDGKIAAVGRVEGRAREEIDVGGAMVAPGFIDCHTHYDAQVCWDPMLSPSVYHGVTSVIAGNCGFTLAPLSGRQEDTDYLLAMLSRVEGMPLSSLEEAVKPTWRSFGEYLDSFDGRIAINTAFMVGHSALRRTVMGERAVGEKATADEMTAMADLLRRSLAEGGAGLSSTMSETHTDHNGDAVPSRWASDEELFGLSAVVGEFPGTWIELIPGGRPFQQRQYDLAIGMSLAAKRTLNWNSFLVEADHKQLIQSQLDMGKHAVARGAKVYGLVPAIPPKGIFNFRSGFALDTLNDWGPFIHLPDDEKIAAMRDPAFRAKLQAGADSTTRGTAVFLKDFARFTIESVGSEKNARWKQRLVSDYAASVGLSPLDALLTLAADEALDMTFSPPGIGADEESWKLRGKLWTDPHLLVGASDAGAHLDLINTFAITTQLLGEGVRQRGLVSLEEGVRLLTSAIADVFGLKGKGRIAEGADADLVVFDADTIGCAPVALRDDLPGGESRLYADSIGVEHVIVNGVPVARGNAPTGRMGGRVLRSGRDTYTVPLD